MTKRIEWVEIARRGRNHAVFFIDVVAQAYRDSVVRRVGGFPFNQLTYRQFATARWVDQADLDRYERFVRQQERWHPGWLVRLARRYETLIRAMRTMARQYQGFLWRTKTNRELVRVFDRFVRILTNMVAYLYFYIYLNRFLSDEFASVIAQAEKDLERQNEAFRVLFSLTRQSEARQEKLVLLQLARRVARKELKPSARSFERQLQLLVQRFSHLSRYVMYGASYTPSDFRRRILALAKKDPEKELQSLRSEIAAAKNVEPLMRSLKLASDVQWKIRGARAWITAAQAWDESFDLLMHHLQPFWDEVSRRLGVRYAELIELTVDEVRSHLAAGRKVSPELRSTARERFRDSATILAYGRIDLLWGAALKRYYRAETKSEAKFRGIRVLTGMPASPGKVRGRVAVTNSVMEIGKVKRGDVLVAAGTTPSHVPAMERAVAIVTDEGGLLCHAAIVSRELKVPCVVGTKVATRVLKDGDRVEVDATNGTVRKL